MKKIILSLLVVMSLGLPHKSFSTGTKKVIGGQVFSDPENNFKFVMDKLVAKYVDKNLTKESLYKAATAGMLASLNTHEEAWNELLSPQDVKDIEGDLSGQVTGIGVEMKFNEQMGSGQILKVLPNSPALKAGLQKDDQILNVNGQKFKGKQIGDLVAAIRGKSGEKVSLKVLREDKILNLEIKREIVPWTPVELQTIDGTTALLTIGYFTNETPKLVEEKILEITRQKLNKVIIDIRDNAGGSFESSTKVSELFLPKGTVVVRTKDRDGKVEKVVGSKGVLGDAVKLIVLTSKKTSSGAEIFVAALKENRNAKIVGENTFGKWNVQTLEQLPNNYAAKFTVKEFLSSQGFSYQDKGIKPDIEVLPLKDFDLREARANSLMSQKLELDGQLKAAYEFSKIN